MANRPSTIKGKSTYRVEENEKEIVITSDLLKAVFQRSTGRMTELVMNGVSFLSHGEGFIYENHCWIEKLLLHSDGTDWRKLVLEGFPKQTER